MTTADKNRIEEEEAYRAEVRNKLSTKEKKTGIGVFGWILIIIIAPIVLISMFMSTNTNTSSSLQKELDGRVNFSNGVFSITNNEDESWENCWARVNSDYKFPSDFASKRFTVRAHETYEVASILFVLDDGTKFNPYATQPKDISLSCDDRHGYWNW